ncbi:M20 family metallo-hydrolase [Paenibacillus ginsengarvi]|uniref:Zn-dependent hydrolase n=1 Tax=Paenibacillus ginsengarvi TaxID=400777 RepID=A0A3B0AQ54_9BACL|nr:M20 family metallo-hydrolase [Paenibacillus ginsengarvi]RKN62779.1 Zn-dependent hydrolase [Paenibacillus ginsengarvi]
MNVYKKLIQDSSPLAKTYANRIAQRLHELSVIGATADHGSARIAYSPEDRTAKELLKTWMREAGLLVREDEIGNVFGTYTGSQPELPAILSGSHIDTVPNGGHFDGVVGVLAALEVAQSWREQGYLPPRSLEVVAFADEEGSRFHASLTGSHFLMGELKLDAVSHYRDDEGRSFEQVLREHGLDPTTVELAARSPHTIHAFVEMHIEQGPVLEKCGLPVGVVDGIAGPAWLEMKWRGKAAHAGTTPMGMRLDALAGASECLLAIERLPCEYSPTAVATVGRMEISPNGSNVVPGEVSFVADVRDIDLNSRDRLLAAIQQEAEAIATRRGLSVESKLNIKIDPAAMSSRLIGIVENAIEQAGLPVFRLSSGAGHDAMVMKRHVPTVMIFIRCLDGISHNPKEWATLDDIAVGFQVLDKTLRQLATEITAG